MSALRSADFPACGFWGHSCPQFQELRTHLLLITPRLRVRLDTATGTPASGTAPLHEPIPEAVPEAGAPLLIFPRWWQCRVSPPSAPSHGLACIASLLPLPFPL